MKMPLLMILLLSPIEICLAQALQSYRWYPLKGRFPEGECVSFGTTTDGKELVEKLKSEACRPAKTTFVWQKEQCFEIDEATQGQRYGVRVAPELCAPSDSAFSFDPKSRQCWVVDRASAGSGFKRLAKGDECRPPESEIKLVFLPREDASVGGDCLEVHRELGEARWARRLDVRKCKPAETVFAWLSTGALKGECWETATTGPRVWSATAAAQNCRPSEVTHRFIRKSETTGDCFEVDRETQGQRWVQKTSTANCREK